MRHKRKSVLKFWSSNKGFSLIEVLVAVALLSIGLVVIIQNFIIPVKLNTIADNQSKAVYLAEKYMEQALTDIRNRDSEKTLQQALDEINDNGTQKTADEYNKKYQYKITSELDATVGLDNITVTVYWTEKGQNGSDLQQNYSIVTHVGD